MDSLGMTTNLREKRGKEEAAIHSKILLVLKKVMNRRFFLPPIHLRNLSSRTNPPSILYLNSGFKVDE
jgi:hypothetical protein